ncbi:MAG TPA: hypothetical protein VE959_25565 [Bryobacteraceae bacterium]|nr:hypothetical protein [Bryobacteraceae bacterium]
MREVTHARAPSRDLLIAAHQQVTILKLAETLVAEGPIPRKAAGDALPIAIATAYSCEYLLTWNCRHIANAEIQRAARLVVRRQGFELPVICTPEELMGGEQRVRTTKSSRRFARRAKLTLRDSTMIRLRCSGT